MTNKHFDFLDGLRGIAALAVVIFHYHHFFLTDADARSAIPGSDRFPFGFLRPLYDHGNLAVELFWIISGFVFAHVYFNRKTSLPDFARARFARLYPLHLATLLFVAGLQAVSLQTVGHWQVYGNNDLHHFLLQLVFASNSVTLSHGLSFNGPIWSVSLEMASYGIFFLSLPLLLRLATLRRAGLALLFCVTFFLAHEFWPSGQTIITRGVSLCAAFFFGGVALYAFADARPRHYARELTVVLIAIGAASFLWAAPGADTVRLFAACALAILAAACLDQQNAIRPIAAITFLGAISYSLYLVHVPIQMIILLADDIFFGGTRGFASQYWVLPTYLATVIGASALSYRYFELPLNKALRQKLTRARAR